MTTATHKPIEPVLRAMNDGSAVKVVCVGDSLTAGVMPTGGTAATTVPSRLQALLRQYYDNASIDVENKGVSGSTLTGGLSRFATDVTDEDPDLVVFSFGTNDSRQANGVSLETFHTNVKAYLNKLLNVPVVIWTPPPRFKEHDSAEGEDVIGLYRNILKAEAAKRGIPVVDVFGRLHRLYRTRMQAAGLWSSDGSHYTAEGYTHIGDTIFAEAFANDSLFIAPGQFKDARGQWLVSDDGESSWAGTDLQDANAILVETATIRTYLYLEDPEPCDLVLHVIADNANATGQTVTVNNQSNTGSSVAVDTSPDLPTSGTYWMADYGIVTVPLQPGLNNVQLSTATEVRITGFSVVRRQTPLYLATSPDSEDRSEDFWGSSRWRASSDAFEVLRSGVLTVSANASGLIEPYFLLQPEALSRGSSGWRFRATVCPGAAFYLGQQSNDDVDYSYCFKVAFDGTNCVVTARDHAGTAKTLESTALAVAAGGADVQVDIRTGVTGTTIWVNGTQVWSDNIPLCIGWVQVTASATKRSYWNPPMKKAESAVGSTAAIPGEQWISFLDNSLHVTKDDGTEAVIGASGAGGLPTGGTSGQALLKSSGTDYDAGWSSLTKSSVGLGNVDNTSDVNKPVSTAQTAAFAPKSRTIEMKTGNYTLVLSDAGKHFRMNVAGANSLTIPPNSSVAFPDGTDIWVEQTGAGATTVTAGAGVTFRSTVGESPSARYGVVHYRKIASDTWQVISRT